MGSLNQVTIIGNLGKDADMRYTPSGDAVANFSVATNERWTDKGSGEVKEHVEWHRVVLWGKSAESLKDYLLKGKQVCVMGSLRTRKWTDRDGNDRYTTEIRAQRIVLLGSSGEGGTRRQARAEPEEEFGGTPDPADPGTASQAQAGQDVSNDDIPF